MSSTGLGRTKGLQAATLSYAANGRTYSTSGEMSPTSFTRSPGQQVTR
jgi:hypothetical protein